MPLSLSLHNGEPIKPVVLLIHGLGMNNYFWTEPTKCMVLGGMAPLTVFLADQFKETGRAISFGSADPYNHGLWNFLQAAGFSLASWSQSQPLGPIQIAVEELRTALHVVRSKWPGKSVYIIGHSRGGVIARRVLLDGNLRDIEGLITICSPHAGTAMAKFSRYLKPAGILLEKIVPHKSKAHLTKTLSRIAQFFQSPAIAELTPEAEFIAAIKKPLPQEMRKLSFGGTSPALFQAIVSLPGGRHKTIKFPDLLAGIIPAGHFPRELTPGFGDGLVTAHSARLAGSQHYDFPVNHVKAAYDHKIHEIIRTFLS